MDPPSTSADALKDQFTKINLQLRANASEFQTLYSEIDLASDDGTKPDPKIVAADSSAQTNFLRKLKFQYIEQNAKDRYVKSIVSDIDDAPIVTPQDNEALKQRNDQKKVSLKVAKAKLTETQDNIRTLAPLVEQDYNRLETSVSQAAELSQKIIDAQLALARLRQTHPQPRFTVPMADAKLEEQIDEMQDLGDAIEKQNVEIADLKSQVKEGMAETERLRQERAEIEKELKAHREREGEGHPDEDERLGPLYDWYTAAISVHYWIHDLQESHAVSENELRLTYNVGQEEGKEIKVVITLIFVPDTRQLAAVQTAGLEYLGVDMGDTVDSYVQINDAQGAIAAILARARNAAATSS